MTWNKVLWKTKWQVTVTSQRSQGCQGCHSGSSWNQSIVKTSCQWPTSHGMTPGSWMWVWQAGTCGNALWLRHGRVISMLDLWTRMSILPHMDGHGPDAEMVCTKARNLLFMPCKSHATSTKSIRCWQFEARGRKLRNFNVVSISGSISTVYFRFVMSYLHQISQQSWACSHEASVINDVQMIKLILKPSLEIKKWQLGGDICEMQHQTTAKISFVCCNNLWNLEDFMVFRMDVMLNPGLLQLIYQLQADVPCTFLEALFGTVYHVLHTQGFSLDVNAEP